MSKRRGMSMNVAVALGHVSVRPAEEKVPSYHELPCKYSMAWYKDGLSSKDLHLMSKNHTEAVNKVCPQVSIRRGHWFCYI